MGHVHVEEPRPNPDLEPFYPDPNQHGFTAEALFEAGMTLGTAQPVSVGVLIGAGRPIVRAELVVSVPLTL